MKPIILISGQQGSGKTSTMKALSRAIQDSGAFAVQEVAFADPLYAMHWQCLQILKYNGIETPEKDGPLLQLLGTEWGRKQYGDDIWVNIARNRIQMAQDKTLTIISDCRFPNEADAFPGALKYRLECPEEVRKERILSTPGQNWRENTNHPSEVALNDYKGWTNTFDTETTTTAQIVQQILGEIGYVYGPNH